MLNPPYVAEDGSIAPVLSPISDPTNFKVGGVWQMSNGLFVHGGLNYSWGTGGRTVAGMDIDHNPLGVDIRIGWHPGVTPPRERGTHGRPPPSRAGFPALFLGLLPPWHRTRLLPHSSAPGRWKRRELTSA